MGQQFWLHQKIIFHPLHIKLGLIWQIVKSLEKTWECFKYICSLFPILTIEKFKAGIFDGQLTLEGHNFRENDEKEVYFSEPFLGAKFFWERKSENFKNKSEDIVTNFQDFVILARI